MSLWGHASSEEEAKIAVSTAYNQNVLELLNAKVPGFSWDNDVFIFTVYKILALPVLSEPTQEDYAYWRSQLSGSTDQERLRSRASMLARLATESFNPPPVVGMSVFDLVTKNREQALFGVLVAGLLRIQLTVEEFEGGYAIPAKLGALIIKDHICNMLPSSTYSARFRVTSFTGFVDSVKRTLPPAARDPETDPMATA